MTPLKSLPLKIPTRKIIEAVKNPGSFVPLPWPNTQYDEPYTTIAASIRLTMAFLAAGYPPFAKGELMTTTSNEESVFWKFAEHRVKLATLTGKPLIAPAIGEIATAPEPYLTFHYFVTAHYQLARKVVGHAPNQSTAYVGKLVKKRPEVILQPDTINAELRQILMGQLQEFRKQLVE
jgi:hypothetical protein